MAHFTQGSIIYEIRGSVGDLTYSRNAYGPIVKQKVAPYPQGSAGQLTWQARMSAAVAAWQALPEDRRIEYNAAAKAFTVNSSLGRKSKLSGYAYFVRRYMLASKAGQEANEFPLGLKLGKRFELVGFTVSESALNIAINNQGVDAASRFTLFATASTPASITALNPAWLRIITPAGSVAPGLQVFDAFAAYEALFGMGSLSAGDRIWIALQSYNYETGERTADFQLQSIVGP